MKKKHLLWTLCPIITLAALVSTFPMAISTGPGKSLFLKVVNRSLPGVLSIETLSCSWTGPQEIIGLKYQEKNLDLACLKISSTAPLTAFLSGPYKVGKTKLEKPSLTIRPEALISLYEKKSLQTSSFLSTGLIVAYLTNQPINILGEISLEDGTVTVLSSTATVDFDEVYCFFSHEKNSPLSVKAEAKTAASGLPGEISIEALLKTKQDPSLSLKVDITHFPAFGADKVLSLFNTNHTGLLEEFTGSFIDINGSANISKNLCEAALSIQSDNLKANIELGSKGNVASLKSPALLQITVPSAFLTKATNLTLSSPLPLTFTINTLNIPLEDIPLFQNSEISCHVTSAPYPLQPGVTAKLEGNLSSEKIGSAIFAKGEISLSSKESSSKAVASVEIEHPFSSSLALEAALTVDKTSSFLFSHFIKKKHLIETLGNWIEASITLKGRAHTYSGIFSASSPLFSLENAPFTWKDTSFKLKDPVTFSYQIEPDIANNFLPEEILSLSSPSALAINIEKLRFSPEKGLLLDAKIHTDSLLFKKLYRLENYNVASMKTELKINTLNQINLSVQNAALSLHSEWAFQGKNNILLLKKPLYVTYLLKHPTLKALDLPLKDTLLNIKVNKASIPVDGDISSFDFDSSIKIDKVALDGKENETSLQNSEVVAIFSGAKDALYFSFQSHILSLFSEDGSVNCKGTIKSLLKNEPISLLAEAKLTHFNIDLIDEFYPIHAPLEPILGKSLDATLKITSSLESKTLQIEAKTPLLSLKGGLALNNKQLVLLKESGPVFFSYDLTPEGYKALFCLLSKKEAPFVLLNTSKLYGSLLELKAPIDEGIIPDVSQTFLKLNLDNPEATFTTVDSQETFSLKKSRIVLWKTGEAKEITCTLDTEAENGGSFHLEGTIAPLKTATLQATAVKMPSLALDVILPTQKEFFYTLLGPSFNLSATLDVHKATGPLTLHLDSEKATFNLNGYLQEGALKLKEKAKLKVAFPPETSALFLKEDAPIRYVETKAPVTITASPKGFSFPITPFSLNTIQAPHIEIDFGKVHCKSNKSLDLTFKIFRSKNSKKRELDLWFAPLDMSITNGILDIERTEVLVSDKFDCALWGLIDLPKDNVDMILGITASALKKALGLQGLPRDYVLKIPVRGSLDQIEVDGEYATSKITALMIWKNKAVQKGLGPFGEILNQIITPPGGDGYTPPPKRPFPWESN